MKDKHFLQRKILWLWPAVGLSLIPATQGLTVINNCTDLQAIQSNLAENYQLGGNINCSATASWNNGAGFQPLGGNLNPFLGTLDGQGFTISGLTINRQTTNYVGLFGYIGSTAQLNSVGLVGGSVSGADYVGGLVGWNQGSVSNTYAMNQVLSSGVYVGGLVGWNGGTISNSYSTGQVSGISEFGGLVGYSSNGTVLNSYWDTQASGQSTSAGGTGKTTAQLYQQATFVGWNFTTIWWINNTYGYPQLRVPSSMVPTNGSGGLSLNSTVGIVIKALISVLFAAGILCCWRRAVRKLGLAEWCEWERRVPALDRELNDTAVITWQNGKVIEMKKYVDGIWVVVVPGGLSTDTPSNGLLQPLEEPEIPAAYSNH